ncbi:hypothetical protein O9993_06890 [Vibrio lentus]|nr:hypothetical protein [Vibrio lentus]
MGLNQTAVTKPKLTATTKRETKNGRVGIEHCGTWSVTSLNRNRDSERAISLYFIYDDFMWNANTNRRCAKRTPRDGGICDDTKPELSALWSVLARQIQITTFKGVPRGVGVIVAIAPSLNFFDFVFSKISLNVISVAFHQCYKEFRQY